MKTQEYLYTTYIRTTPEKLWHAITTPEFVRQWWAEGMVSDWKKGSNWQHLPNAEKDCTVCGQVLESTPPKRLVISWEDPKSSSKPSRAIFEIEQIEDMVRLNVSHVELDAEMSGKVSQGWPRVLSSLKTLVETGKALPTWASLKEAGAAK
jgi:uncharacterized protein YndB with AHSA1/START domain